MGAANGALISNTIDDGPGDKGGLKVGDIIIKFNGETIERSSDLPPLVGATKVGDKVPVEIVRKGKSKNNSISIGELLKTIHRRKFDEQSDFGFVKKIGIRVKALTEEQQKRFGITSGAVMIDSLEAGSVSVQVCERGDIILQVDNDKVTSVDQVVSFLRI